MVQPADLSENVTIQNRQVSTVREPEFTWKFFNENPSRIFVDKRSKLKGKFIGERFVRSGTELQFRPVTRPIEVGPAEWNGYVFVGLIIMVVMMKRLAARRYNQLLSCLWGNTPLNLMLREWNPSKSMQTFLVSIIYFTGFSLFALNAIGITSSYSGNGLSDFWMFLSIFGGLVVLLSAKFILIRFLSYLFKTPDESLRYMTNHYGFFASTGLAILPILLVLLYNPSEYFVFFGAGIIFIILIVRIVRSFVTGLIQPPFSIFYLFLYLCALEIIPLVLLAKTILMFSNGETWG
ncbi:MAG: DUF4271 domain-containing protein [Bacteroidales bacterium]